jgi:hypothetical protein
LIGTEQRQPRCPGYEPTPIMAGSRPAGDFLLHSFAIGDMLGETKC